jgi:putative Mg2+ transporter-C (MgtC) family protein
MLLRPGEVAIRLTLAFVVGGCVGVERQWNHKYAGVRTHTLVAVGAAGFTIVSALGLGPTGSPMLIAAGVVTGIGFIGGGAIMHNGGGVQGLNTAATLWTTASMGLAAGGGYYAVTGMVFAAVLLVQFPLELVEDWIDRASGRKKIVEDGQRESDVTAT